MSTLFELPQCDQARIPLHLMREELQRELSEAVKAAAEVPEYFLDVERCQDLFRGLVADGDESWARAELLECFDMRAGFARHFDRMNDHINTLAWAYWRLHRAERRAYGKESA